MFVYWDKDGGLSEMAWNGRGLTQPCIRLDSAVCAAKIEVKMLISANAIAQ